MALDVVGGQRHSPAALPLGKTRYPLYRRLGRTKGRSGRVWKISPLPGFDPPDRPARSESLYQLGWNAQYQCVILHFKTLLLQHVFKFYRPRSRRSYINPWWWYMKDLNTCYVIFKYKVPHWPCVVDLTFMGSCIVIIILIYIYPKRCNYTQFILSGNCSKYFGWYHHPSSGAHTPVSTASGICHTVTAICRYQLEPVW
jgi:hypothetical protein